MPLSADINRSDFLCTKGAECIHSALQRYRQGSGSPRTVKRRMQPSLYATAILLFLFLLSCGHQDDQRKFEEAAFSQPDGWVSTDFQGKPTGEQTDPDDWRIAPFFQGSIEVRPAYPNPAPQNELIYIEFVVQLPDAVMELHAFVLDHPVIPLDDITISPLPPGEDRLQFISSQLSGTSATPSGLYRIILLDGRNNVVSYGDVMIE